MLVLVGACDSSSRERAAPPDTIAEHLRSDPRWLTREGLTTSSSPPPTHPFVQPPTYPPHERRSHVRILSFPPSLFSSLFLRRPGAHLVHFSLFSQNLLFLSVSVRILAAKRTRVTLPWGPHAAKGTARHRSGIWTRVGIDNEGEPFPLLSRQRGEGRRRRGRRLYGWKTKRKKKGGRQW